MSIVASSAAYADQEKKEIWQGQLKGALSHTHCKAVIH